MNFHKIINVTHTNFLLKTYHELTSNVAQINSHYEN